MKTASDILLDKESESNGFQGLYTFETAMEAMQEYASQFIDAAAKEAKTIKMGNSGSSYDVAVDRQSILKLKEQLK